MCNSVKVLMGLLGFHIHVPSEAANGSKVRTVETGAKRASPSPVNIQLSSLNNQC